MAEVILHFATIVRKAHSLYVSLRPALLREAGWKRGDKIVAVMVEGDVVLRRLKSQELIDGIIGAVKRRRDGTGTIKVAGAWDWRSGPKAGT